MSRLKYYLNEFQNDDYWEIIVRGKRGINIFDYNSNSFRIKSSKRYWYADPFLVNNNDKTYLFFEIFDRLKIKGQIGYIEISDISSSYEIKNIIVEKFHLSYPHIFSWKDSVYMIPESSSNNDISLYKATHFPDKWIKIKTLVKSVKAVDTNILKYENKYYLISSLLMGNSNNVQEAFYEFDMDLMEVVSSAIFGKKGDLGVRNAGRFIYRNDQVIRFTQDCSDNNYGSGIVISDFSNFTSNFIENISFREVQYRENSHIGIHTYTECDKYEAIDLKYRKKNNIFRIAFLLMNIIVKSIKRRFK